MVEQVRQLRVLLERALRFRYVRIVVSAVQAYGEHRCAFVATGLTFYAVLSLIPLLVVGLWAVTAIAVAVGQLPLLNQWEASLNQYLLPATTDMVMAHVHRLSDPARLLSILGAWWAVLVFIWSGVRFFELLQVALSTAWGGSGVRPFWRRQLVTVAAFLAAGVLGGATVVLTTALTAFDRLGQTMLGYSPHLLLELAAGLLPFGFSILLFALLYKYMPTVQVSWRLAFGTAVPVAITWEVTKYLFTLLVVERGLYASIYGPLSSFVLLLLWVYATAVIVIFGAEVGAAWQAEYHRAPQRGDARAIAPPAVKVDARPG